MTSLQSLRVFINDRLLAAAEEIFSVFQQAIEEEVRRNRSLETDRKTQIKFVRTESSQRHAGPQKTSSSVEREKPEAPHVKDEDDLVEVTVTDGERDYCHDSAKDWTGQKLAAAAAAGELITVFEQTLVPSEENEHQRRLLKINWKPTVKLHRTEVQQQHDGREKQLSNQEPENCGEQQGPERPPVKEEEPEPILVKEEPEDPEPPLVKQELEVSPQVKEGKRGAAQTRRDNTQYQWPVSHNPSTVDVILPAASVIPWPVYNSSSSAGMVTLPAAGPCNNVQRISLPQFIANNLQPVGSLICRNGEPVCVLHPPAPQVKAKTTKKRRPEQPKVKKPLNAFMLFLKEQRPMVMAEHKGSGSAGVNKVLGERWKLLSEEQKAKYYDQAETEAELHAQRHPGFSCSHNYGKRRKRMGTPTEDEYVIQHPKLLLV